MPTSRLTTLLLLAAVALPEFAQANQDTLAPNYERHRPGAASIGPRSAPRRRDAAVEPATFQSFAEAKPIQPAPSTTSEPEPAPKAIDAELLQVSKVIPVEEPPAKTQRLPIGNQPSKLNPTSPAEGSDQDSGRRLFGTSPTADTPISKRQTGLGENPLQSLMTWRPSTQTLTATGGGLAIAVGLVLAFAWLARCCVPKSARPLPRDVVEVLGRAPLGGKQTTQLVRVGSKLVLVAITPDGAETLTEITDPGEVARLVAACDSNSGRGANAEFDAMLREMSDERTAPGFLGDQSSSDDYGFDPRSLAAAYANTPGGRGDG